MTRRTSILSLGFVCSALLMDSVHAQTPVTSLPVTARAPSTMAPTTNGAATPTYEQRGRRDPFESVAALHPDLVSATVASARLKGIVRGRELLALLETPDGLGYILKVGGMLAEGRLVEIGADRVVFDVPTRFGTTDRIVLRLAGE